MYCTAGYSSVNHLSISVQIVLVYWELMEILTLYCCVCVCIRTLELTYDYYFTEICWEIFGCEATVGRTKMHIGRGVLLYYGG